MSASDGNGTARPSTFSYQVQMAWPADQESDANPSRNQNRRRESVLLARMTAASPAAKAMQVSPMLDTSWLVCGSGDSSR